MSLKQTNIKNIAYSYGYELVSTGNKFNKPFKSY